MLWSVPYINNENYRIFYHLCKMSIIFKKLVEKKFLSLIHIRSPESFLQSFFYNLWSTEYHRISSRGEIDEFCFHTVDFWNWRFLWYFNLEINLHLDKIPLPRTAFFYFSFIKTFYLLSWHQRCHNYSITWR